MSNLARIYIAAIISGGTIAFAIAMHSASFGEIWLFLVFLAASLVSSLMKVKLPGVDGTISVNFPFILLAFSRFTLIKSVLVGCFSVLAQCLWRAKTRPEPVKIAFNLASSAISVTIAHTFITHAQGWVPGLQAPLLLALTAALYFVVNTGSTSVIVALISGQPILKIWRGSYFWSFPYYVVSACLITGIQALNPILGWQTWILIVPVI